MISYEFFDGSWENDPLDIRSIRFDAEMEERAENNCNDCEYGIGSRECLNCYVGGK